MKVVTDPAAFYATVAVSVVLLVAGGYYLRRGRTSRRRPPVEVEVNLTDDELVKQGFATKKVPDDVDVIVIGSGMGGLSVAAVLAKEGKRVLVLEQHDVVGGNTHTFEEGGYEFDTGFHYVGGHLDDKSYPNRKLFDYISNNSVEFQRLGDTVDVAVAQAADGARDAVHFTADHDIFKKYLKTRFPDDHASIDAYFKAVKAASIGLGTYFGLQVCPTWLRGAYRWWNKSKLEYFHKTVLEVVSSLTTNAELVGILNYSWGDFGDPPSRAAFVLNAVILNHYRGGAYYAIGGPSVIAKKVARVIESHGGKVLVRAPVSQVLIDASGAAYGVRVKDKDILARTIISTVGAPQTYTKLIPQDHQHRVERQVRELQNPALQACCSLMSLFVGFKGDAQALDLPTHNVWKYPSWSHDANFKANQDSPDAPFCALFMSFSSAKDPTYATRFPGKQVGLVVAPCFYPHVEKFKDGRVKRRGDDYEALKAVWKERMLTEFLNEFPKVTRESIEVAEFGTALSNDYYLGTTRGAIYGLGHTPARFTSDVTNPRTPIANLYLSGQDVLSCGILGAAYGGLVTAAVIEPSLLPKLGKLLSKTKQ
ncbi:hypothetical protein DYB28_006877 [Aphanomyces astaci]|uniref:Amine oxidase domain-containing protein n=1 Tax=Aphanomyces astaci TaxID=112090 RepID=A0A397DQN5_APHAT|nr:hypothetical protein DYB36_003341 [Aphanomyces astaci]RHY14156.1 hypothetical protein DYB25_001157 [Aphanomyces astaci]RHY40520.1 hypothetical protein DYB34_005478 [Aphanomyces astaci]RHY60995.1 hypothetical protein DYB38_002697 [Aphanomyces astaci]RHY66681.1 hypothetical protein DYB30_005723 [Aphanomyces astaci]